MTKKSFDVQPYLLPMPTYMVGTFVFDQVHNGYYAIGEKVGQAWNAGMELMKK